MLEFQITKTLWYFDLELHVRIGNQILVLWGPSGSGKTTVLHCLAGLLKPSAGFIELNDRVLFSSDRKINVPARLRNTGYLFQDYALFSHMTVRHNVMYGLLKRKNRPGTDADVVELLKLFGVEHLADRYPGQLSGGEKQRVALARALAVQPELLLLDEPLNALDKNTRVSLRQEIKKIHRRWRIPFVLVTHNEEDAGFLGDEIVYLNRGRLFSPPSPATL
ncbi:MAG TPA: ATP-binding cassette domain-containing protein [Bacillota bacterium]|nr:ATP-binding cassette domain-containing protein [Bacillota bacterium]